MKRTLILLIVLFTFSALISKNITKITTEEDMVKAVFETIQNNDLETFLSYCITEDGMTKIINGMVETTPKEKAIKQDIQEESVENFRDESTNSFNSLLKELTDNNFVLKKSELSKTITKEPRFEITNLIASEIKFEVSFNETIYEISVDLLISQGDFYIYNFHFYEIDIEKE